MFRALVHFSLGMAREERDRDPSVSSAVRGCGILRLPTDILLCIFDLQILDLEDFKNLRLSHSHFLEVTSPQIFCRITLAAGTDSIWVVGRLGHQELSGTIATFNLQKSLVPLPVQGVERLTVSRFGPSNGDCVDEQQVLDNQLRVLQCAHRHMTRLKSVRWHCAGLASGPTIQTAEWEGIFDRGLDIHLTICSCIKCGVPSKFGDAGSENTNVVDRLKLRNITKLTITGTADNPPEGELRADNVADLLAEVISRSLTLKSLEILCLMSFVNEYKVKQWQTSVFRKTLEGLYGRVAGGTSLAQAVPRRYPDLPIEELTFVRVNLRSKAFLHSLPNLKRLKVLESTWGAPIPELFFNRPRGPLLLEEASFEEISRETEGYLRSRQLIGTLRCLDVGMQNDRSFNSMARGELYRCTIPTHRRTLKELHLRSCVTGYEDGWSPLGIARWALDGCNALRVLTITPGRTREIYLMSLLDRIHDCEEFLPLLECLNLRECGKVPVARSSSFLAVQIVPDCQSGEPFKLRRWRNKRDSQPESISTCGSCIGIASATKQKLLTTIQHYQKATRGHMMQGLEVTTPQLDAQDGYLVWKWREHNALQTWVFEKSVSDTWD